MPDRLKQLAKNTQCPIFCDELTRQLYATDASIHQVIPKGVAFPRTVRETAEIMAAATSENIPLIPRGAGSGLTGGALGDALILDMSRYNRFISDFNRDACTVRVGAGVVLDQLNEFLKPFGLTFGPDVATSSRATLGGMIANNSSGARAPLYGTTIDHVLGLEVVTADGESFVLSADSTDMRDRLLPAHSKILSARTEIEQRFHRQICKRWPGYGLDRYLWSVDNAAPNPAKLIAGSEGTLCTIYAATLHVVPLPLATAMVLLFFDSVAKAMQAAARLLDLKPAGIEHIDDLLFNQTRGQFAFRAARALLELDDKPCTSILLVEFYEDADDRIAEVLKLKLGLRHYVCKDDREKALVWHLRKAGLSLLNGRPGPAKPIEGIEDVAVPPHRLPDYVHELTGILNRLGLQASFYGHAASGLLHVRPVLDLHTEQDIRRYKLLLDEVSDLARTFKGSLTAEHGVGISRNDYVREHIGPELFDIMTLIKQAFDPKRLMNPGKIVEEGPWNLNDHLRQGPGAAIPIPFEPVVLFQAKDHSFVGNLEQCNGCAGCRKDTPVMCPTFQATGDECMSTRGRANIIRAVLEGRLDDATCPLLSPALDVALSNCLSCKACTVECPSNVNMSLLKAELLYARYRKHGTPLVARVISRLDLLGKLACMFPNLTNTLLKKPLTRLLLQQGMHISPKRPLPEYTNERFDKWFTKHKPAGPTHRGQVLLWDDCFIRYNEPHIGRAAVTLLEATGYTVQLVKNHACCGRPAFSMGRLDLARRFGQRNLELLGTTETPLIFLEPSCYAMFREEYLELGLEGAKEAAERAILFEPFIELLLQKHPEALPLLEVPNGIALHTHCHAKAMTDIGSMHQLAQRIGKSHVQLLDSGCCGMAGAFGMLEDKFELSLSVAESLLRQVNALPQDTYVIASGASCRQQIAHLSNRQPIHFAELLCNVLAAK